MARVRGFVPRSGPAWVGSFAVHALLLLPFAPGDGAGPVSTAIQLVELKVEEAAASGPGRARQDGAERDLRPEQRPEASDGDGRSARTDGRRTRGKKPVAGSPARKARPAPGRGTGEARAPTGDRPAKADLELLRAGPAPNGTPTEGETAPALRAPGEADATGAQAPALAGPGSDGSAGPERPWDGADGSEQPDDAVAAAEAAGGARAPGGAEDPAAEAAGTEAAAEALADEAGGRAAEADPGGAAGARDEGRAAADDGARRPRTIAHPTGGAVDRPAVATDAGRPAAGDDADGGKATARASARLRPELVEEAKRSRQERRAEDGSGRPPVRWHKFVRTEAPTTGAAPGEAEYIAAHDVVAPREARPEVTGAEAGPRLDGMISRTLGQPRAVQAPPSRETQAASGRSEEVPDPSDQLRQQATAAPPAPSATSAAPVTAGAEHPERAALPALHAPPSTRPSSAGGLAAEASPDPPIGAVRAAEVHEVPAILLPDWWNPSAARIDGAAVRAQDPDVDGSVAAPEAAPDLPASAGATALVWALPVTAAPPAAQAPTGLAPDPSRPPVARQAKDPVVQDPRGHPHPVRPTEPYAPRHSPQAVFDDPEDVERVEVTAKATALGEWAWAVDTELRARWERSDLPTADTAFGLDGEVVVEFQVTASGRVDDVRIVVGSGSPLLDAMARLAIPPHLPKPPHGPVRHRVTFRLR